MATNCARDSSGRIKASAWYTDLLGESVLGDSHSLEKRLAQVFTGGHRL